MNATRILSAACIAAILAPAAAPAALVLQSENASYSLDAAGTRTADVRLYLVQTGGTTTLTTGGGLNSAGFVVTANTLSGAPALISIAPNPSFSGSNAPSLAGGTLYEDLADLNAGVPADAGRVFLGTFSYRFTGGNASPSTTFTVADRPGFDGFYTATGDLIDASIQPGTFTVTVPEPTTLAALGGVSALALRRRRRGSIAGQ